MIQIGNKNTNYGNWVPAAMMKTCGVVIAVLVFTMYMKKCRDIFDFNKGGMMGKVHQYLVDHMAWDGNGTLLDILRVVKKGGSFAFQDMFEQKALYGDMDAFIKELKSEGITEVHYIGNVEKEEFIPDFVTAPWMIKGAVLIYGKK